MSTRYLTRSALQALLRDSDDPLAERAIAALNPAETGAVPVHSGGFDLKTLEVRLARSESGEGPMTPGLPEFVEALRRPIAEPEGAGFQGGDGTHFLVLFEQGGVAAITATESP
jgi:hypothetical protein